MKKLSRIVLFTLAFLLIFFSICFTPWGTRTILHIASSSIDGLSIEYGEGGLGGELTINSLRWQNAGVDASVENLLLNMDWQCSMSLRACIRKLYVDVIEVEVIPVPDGPESTASTERIALPFLLQIEQVGFGLLKVNIPQQLNVDVEHFDSKLRFFRTLNIDHLNIEAIKVNQIQTKEKEPVDGKALIAQIEQWQYPGLQLDALQIPIKLALADLTLGHFELWQNGVSSFNLSELNSAITTTYNNFQVKQLSFKTPDFMLQMSANVAADFEHKLQAMAQLSHGNNGNSNLQLNSSGKLDAIAARLSVDGTYQAKAQLNVNLISQQLPLDAKLEWQNIAIQSDQDQVLSEFGSLSLNGDIENVALNVNAHAEGSQIPATELTLSAKGNHRKLTLDKLHLASLDGLIEATGLVTVSDLVKMNLNTKLSGIHPQSFWPDIEADINGNLDVNFVYDGEHFQLHSDELNLFGSWFNRPLKTIGSIDVNSKTGINSANINLLAGDNRLNIDGQLDANSSIAAKLILDAPELSQLLPALEGSSQGEVSINGVLPIAEFTIDVTAEDLVLDELAIENVVVKGTGGLGEDSKFDISTKVAAAQIQQQDIEYLNLALMGSRESHTLNVQLQSDLIELALDVTGQLAQNEWKGSLNRGMAKSSAGEYQTDSTSIPIRANWLSKEYTLAAHCWRYEEAKLCVDKSSWVNHQADFGVSGHDLKLVAFAAQLFPDPERFASEAAVDFSLLGNWTGSGLPVVELTANVSPAQWSFKRENVTLNVTNLNLQANVDAQQVNSKLNLSTDEIGSLRAEIKILDPAESRTLDGTLAINSLLLAPLKNLFPQLHELDGTINSQVSIKGDLQAPQLYGQTSLQDMAFSADFLPSSINQLNQSITFKGQGVAFEGPYRLGEGPGFIKGELTWLPEVIGDIHVTGEEMEFDYKNTLRAKVSPDIHIDFTPNNLKVSGDVNIPYARVKVRELPPSAVSPSADTVVINRPQEDASTLKVTTDLRILIDKQKTNEVKIDAFGLTSDLQGSLALSKKGDVMLGDGDLRLVNGRYRAYGQDLVIRKGDIIFAGPIVSPMFNIEAIRDPVKTADNVIAGLRVEGAADNPQISVFSNPSMEQSAALSYLLRGQSITSNEETSTDAALADALIGFGLSKSENKITRVGQKLGVEDLALGTSGQGEETKISVSGNIAPGVQLRYGVGVFDSSSEVAIRYQVMPKLYLEAVSGLQNALDIYYQFSIRDDEETDTP